MAEQKIRGKKKQKAPVQRYLPIAELRDDVVVTRNGELRGVFLASSVNFALKSEEEQEAIVYSYIRFLNAIDFPIQILIQSRKLDMDAHLFDLDRRRREQTNELLKMQMGEYIEFVRELVELGQIMTKHFYVVVPYNPGAGDKKHKFSILPDISSILSPGTMIRMREKTFRKYKEELEKRMAYVEGQMSQMSVRAVRLQTQSLIELFYRTYNPDISQTEKFKEVERLRVVDETSI